MHACEKKRLKRCIVTGKELKNQEERKMKG